MKQHMVYHGYYKDGRPVVERRVSGEELTPDRSQMLNNYSNEFEWGYHGSGPAQLALALLLDYYGSERKARAYHQRFKREVIADLSAENAGWVLRGTEIEEVVDRLEEETQLEATLSEPGEHAEPI